MSILNASRVRAGRNRLLATSSLTISALLSGLGLAASGMAISVFSPSMALAADVGCAPDASGTAAPAGLEVCSGAGDGISYTGAANDVSVTLTGVTTATSGVTVSNAGAFKIDILTAGAASSITAATDAVVASSATGPINIDLNGATVTGTSNYGIWGASGGAVTITDTGDAVKAGVTAVVVKAQSGTASVTTGGTVDATNLGNTIFVTNKNGGITINATAGAQTSGFSGIYADDTSGTGGAINIKSAALTASGVGQIGIDARGKGGTVTIDTTAGTTTASGGTGISAQTADGSAIDITTGAVDAGSIGISASTSGAVTLVTGAVTGGDDAISVSAGAGLVNITTNGLIKGGSVPGADGIQVTGATGGIKVTTNAKVSGDPAINLSDNSAVGIATDVAGGADALLDAISLIETGAGPVTLDIKSLVQGDTDDNGTGNGATISGTTGTITATITAAGSIDGTSQDGINASLSGATGAGDKIVIVNDGSIGSSGNAVDATGITATLGNKAAAGNINISGAGGISATGAAISAVNSGSGDISITYTGAILGGSGIGASATGAGDTDITIKTDGTVKATAGAGITGSISNTGSTGPA